LMVIEACASSFPKADLVFYLDLDPRLALQRKSSSRLNAYECGRNKPISETGFLQHQRRVREVLSRWADRDGWYTIDASRPAESVQADVFDILRCKISANEGA
jgi:thymidylate kinase